MTSDTPEQLTFETLHSRIRLRGQLVALTGLRIGAGRDTDVTGNDLPVMRDASGRPFIPGSSLKGVLRAYLEAVLRGLHDDPQVQRQRLACMVLQNEQRCIPSEPIDARPETQDNNMKTWREQMRNEKIGPDELAQRVAQHSCMACQTFGSTWLASHIAIRDLLVLPALWFGQFEIRQGVSLDRDTDTAGQGLLYSFETVPPGTRFALEIDADNLLDWQKGLFWLGVQPLLRGDLSLGGARSRGLGQVELVGDAWSVWERDPDDRLGSLRALLAEEQFVRELPDDQTDRWREAFLSHAEEVLRA
jgi:CRISPR-associated RAMP protein (TIGR02581 family)